MTAEVQKLRNEFQRKAKNGELKKGAFCANCGTAVGLEIHHIVPLSKGGTNAKTNITTLCWRCHAAAHDKKRAKRCDAGRSRIEKPANCSDVMRSVIGGKTESSAAWRSLGVSKNTFYKWLREYVEANEIERNGHNFGRGGRKKHEEISD